MDTTLFGRGWVNKVPFDWTQRTQRHYALPGQYPDHHHRRHHYPHHHQHHHIITITDCQSLQGYEEVEKVDKQLLTAF